MTVISTDQEAQPTPVALFISDLHLQTDMPKTTAAFLSFLTNHATRAKQLFLLGDIFEYWAGDDDLDSPYPKQIVEALKKVTDAGVELFWMAGNRDFLVGANFAAATKGTLLADPYTFDYANHRYLLSHGDQLCTDDKAYQQFRAQVRQAEWQTQFLAQPLNDRKNMIAEMRKQSRLHQQRSPMIMDVNQDAVDAFVKTHKSPIFIHGHTHRPALHTEDTYSRYVLSDWDLDTTPARGDWLALMSDGKLKRYNAIEKLEMD